MAATVSPQPLAAGEPFQRPKENATNTNMNPTYVNSLNQTHSTSNLHQTCLIPIEVVHGIPTLKFTLDERQAFAKEEGLHQAIVVKLSQGAPDLSILRLILPKFLGIKGHCLIGLLAQRQLLIRMDQYDDFVASLSRGVNYFTHNGKNHQIRIFPWSIGFNSKKETSRAAVWISFPNMSTDLFAKRSLLSIASAVGKPIAVDKATQVRSRPSTARVRVILDLLEKHPDRIRLQSVDNATGRIIEEFQEVVYDNLPQYCTHCNHQGHNEEKCRLLIGKKIVVHEDDATLEIKGPSIEKLQGDARDYLNNKKQQQHGDNMRDIPVGQALARVSEILAKSSRDDKEVALDLCPNSHSDDENHEVLATKVQEAVQEAVQLTKIKSNAVNTGVVTGSLMVSKQAMELNNDRDDIGGEGWTVVSHKQFISPQMSKEPIMAKEQGHATKDIVCRNNFEALLDKNEHQSGSGSPRCQIAHPELASMLMQQVTSLVCPVPILKPSMVSLDVSAFEIPSQSMNLVGERCNDSAQQLILIGNDHDEDEVNNSTPAHSSSKVEAKSDKKSDTKNIVSWAEMVEEEMQVLSPPTCSKLSPIAPAFVPSYAMVLPSLAAGQLVAQTIAPSNAVDATDIVTKWYESDALAEDLWGAFGDDLGCDIVDEEDENEALDECFAKVARDGDISPRQQRKGFKTKKTHVRKHSWDGKVSEGIVPRQLPMRAAKQKETRFNYINKIQE